MAYKGFASPSAPSKKEQKMLGELVEQVDGVAEVLSLSRPKLLKRLQEKQHTGA